MDHNETQESATAFHMTGRLLHVDSVILYCDSEFRTPREDALLTLDRDGELRLEVREVRGGDGIPMDEWQGRTMTWTVLERPAEVDIARLRAALNDGGALHDLMSCTSQGLI
jgi:hypothetical protein